MGCWRSIFSVVLILAFRFAGRHSLHPPNRSFVVRRLLINQRRSKLQSNLATDTALAAVDSTLEADILKEIPNDISELYSTCINCLYGANREQSVWHKRWGLQFRFVNTMIPVRVEMFSSEF